MKNKSEKQKGRKISMSIRTDLAVEAVEFAGEQMPEGVVRSEEERNGVKITRVEVVDETAAQQVGKPIVSM